MEPTVTDRIPRLFEGIDSCRRTPRLFEGIPGGKRIPGLNDGTPGDRSHLGSGGNPPSGDRIPSLNDGTPRLPSASLVWIRESQVSHSAPGLDEGILQVAERNSDLDEGIEWLPSAPGSE